MPGLEQGDGHPAATVIDGHGGGKIRQCFLVSRVLRQIVAALGSHIHFLQQKKINRPEIRSPVDKIAQYSQELVQKMSEIIWAMNSNLDTVENLVAYIRRYAVDFLEINGLRHHINEPEEMPDYAISGERRQGGYHH